jgi:hypothetical protein
MKPYNILYGEMEFKKKNNKIYNIYIINNLEYENHMISIFDNFIINQNKNTKESKSSGKGILVKRARQNKIQATII